MSFRFVKHIPGFADGVEPEESIVSSLEDINALDTVQRISSYPNFVTLSKSEYRRYGKDFIISVFYDDTHWVVGYIKPTDPESEDAIEKLIEFRNALDLPEWETCNAELDTRRNAGDK